MLLGTGPADTRLPAVKAAVFQILNCALDNTGVRFCKTRNKYCQEGLQLYIQVMLQSNGDTSIACSYWIEAYNLICYIIFQDECAERYYMLGQ